MFVILPAAAAAVMLTVPAPADAAMPRPADILAATRRVADWQIAHRDSFERMPSANASTRDPRGWQQATFWVALTELADRTRDPRYTRTILDLGRNAGWRLGDRPFHADDQLIAAGLALGVAPRGGAGGGQADDRLFRPCAGQSADQRPALHSAFRAGRSGLHDAVVLVRRPVHGAAKPVGGVPRDRRQALCRVRA